MSSAPSFNIPPVIAPKQGSEADGFATSSDTAHFDAHASTDNNTASSDPSQENVNMLQKTLSTYLSAEEQLMKSTSVSEHKYPRLFFRGSAVCALLMLILFIIWMLVDPYGYPWFIHPLHFFGMIIAILFAAGHTSSDIHKKLYSVHTSWIVLTITMFIIANLSVGGFPWFIFPCTFFIILFGLHSLWYKFYSTLSPLSVHVLFFFSLNIMLFVWYCYGAVRFPWNLPILIAWTIVLIIHTILHVLFWKRISSALSSKFSKGFTSAPPSGQSNIGGFSGSSASKPFEVPTHQDPFANMGNNVTAATSIGEAHFDEFQNGLSNGASDTGAAYPVAAQQYPSVAVTSQPYAQYTSV